MPDLVPHHFEWAWNGHRWEGEYSEHLRSEYIWWVLAWPSRLMLKRMRNAYLRLPPDTEDEQPPEGMARDGTYVPPACCFQMGPTCEDEEVLVAGTIYLPG